MDNQFTEGPIRKRGKYLEWKLCTLLLIICTLLCVFLCIYFYLEDKDNCACNSQNKASSCSVNSCLYNGTCAVVDDSFFCLCPAGYKGRLCEVTPCSNTPCLFNGTCTVTGESYVCVCPDRFSGQQCEDTPCTKGPCMYNGSCQVTVESYDCVCRDGYTGTRCEVTPCHNEPCKHNGTCSIKEDSYVCDCTDGFGGRQCEVTPCSNNPCLYDDTCTVTGNSYVCVCSEGYTGLRCEERIMKDCIDLPYNSSSGVYNLYLTNNTKISVFCEMSVDNGGWTVVQRRTDGKLDFFRFWDDYKTGFGDLTGDHWLGNNNLHAIMQEKSYTVRFDLEGFDGTSVYAIYDHFSINSEETNYALSISGYHGTAGDPMIVMYGENVMFSTRDRHDITNKICAHVKLSGWWFVACTHANINGVYGVGSNSYSNYWKPWKGIDGLKSTKMMIKPN